MKERINLILFAFATLISLKGSAQCNIIKEITQYGIPVEFTDKQLLYTNLEKELYAQVRHEGNDFFLILIARPYLKKEFDAGSIQLVSDKNDTLSLELYDVNYHKKDSSADMLFLIPESARIPLQQYNIQFILADIAGMEKTYILKLHKDLIKMQMACLSDKKE